MSRKNTTVFVSYSWDDETHKAWVQQLGARLRRDGVDVKLDQWETAPGDQLPAFMERAIRDNEYVLLICTPRYRARSENREGGVGYEGDIMTAEVLATGNPRKFIPILRGSTWSEAAPSWLSGKYYVDLRGDPYFEDAYHDLLTTIYGTRPQAPPLGPIPEGRRSAEPSGFPFNSSAPEQVKMQGVVAEAAEPRTDTLRGPQRNGRLLASRIILTYSKDAQRIHWGWEGWTESVHKSCLILAATIIKNPSVRQLAPPSRAKISLGDKTGLKVAEVNIHFTNDELMFEYEGVYSGYEGFHLENATEERIRLLWRSEFKDELVYESFMAQRDTSTKSYQDYVEILVPWVGA